jgi:hypothetical protein
MLTGEIECVSGQGLENIFIIIKPCSKIFRPEIFSHLFLSGYAKGFYYSHMCQCQIGFKVGELCIIALSISSLFVCVCVCVCVCVFVWVLLVIVMLLVSN